jgi:hypothetical protein
VVLDVAILGKKSVIASRHFKSFVYITFIHHVCCSSHSIAMSALKSLYISHLISSTSVAFRKIAQAAGGVQGQGELVPWCHKFSSVFLSCFDHILITVCFCLSLMVSCFNVLCHVVVSH